jgi:hypothetical protein
MLLASCAGNVRSVDVMNAKELQAQNSILLCNEYASSQSDKARSELTRRNLIETNEWDLIEQKTFRVGMSELALMCSLGRPGRYGDMNQTVTASGTGREWVYRSCSACPATYIYAENQVITGFKN